jgi:hypothetical protein
VPNRIVNSARISATHSALSSRIGTAPILAGITMSGYCRTMAKLLDTALSCSEMYGRMPTTAMRVTTPPSSALFP